MFSEVGRVSFVQFSGVCGFSGSLAFRVISRVSQRLVPKFVPKRRGPEVHCEDATTIPDGNCLSSPTESALSSASSKRAPMA